MRQIAKNRVKHGKIISLDPPLNSRRMDRRAGCAQWNADETLLTPEVVECKELGERCDMDAIE